MPVSPDYRDYILDLLSAMDGVSPRAMFGGCGLFRGGVMFALITRQDRFYFRVDDINRPDFEAADCEQFQPHENKPQSKPVRMPYFEAPVDAMEDPDELCAWGERAWEAAQRNKNRQAR